MVSYHTLQFFLKQPIPSNKLTVLPLIQTYRDAEKAICIEMPMISQAEKLGTNIPNKDQLIFAIRLDEWNRVLSISFRDRDYCSLILEEIQLQMSLTNQLPCQPSQFIKYISDEVISNKCRWPQVLALLTGFFRIKCQLNNSFLISAKTNFLKSRRKMCLKLSNAPL